MTAQVFDSDGEGDHVIGINATREVAVQEANRRQIVRAHHGGGAIDDGDTRTD